MPDIIDFHAVKDSEIIIGLVSAVGTDLNGVIQSLCNILKGYNYNCDVISISKDVISSVSPIDAADEYERIEQSMNAGNEMRKQICDDILVFGAMNKINEKRGDSSPLRRKAYIINSLKHESEVKRLRDVYGNGFYLMGIFCSKEDRLSYLSQYKHIEKDKAEELIQRDENEEYGHGQHTRDTFQMADYFVNYNENDQRARVSMKRFVSLMFGDPFETPTFDEYAMFCAYCASLRSADLSRQIGAAICKNNEIVATGVNDCPQYCGGLYWRTFEKHNEKWEYRDADNGRDYKLKQDPNKAEFQSIADNILEVLGKDRTNENYELLRKSKLANLTEYGRVVHAEMEALAMCARNNISCRGSDIYVTTFPCHNCAKHLIAAGIKRVVYIEPYPKSKAIEFYPDAMTDNQYCDDKVRLEPYFGVSPTKFINMFSMKYGPMRDRKRKQRDGRIVEWKRENANVRDQMLTSSYLEREAYCADKYLECIDALKIKGGAMDDG